MTPNILFICADEQAVSTIGAYGNPIVRTPNIDLLASKSILFEHAYTTQPVCTSARSSLQTGKYPHATGCTENNLPLDSSILTFPEIAGSEDGHTYGYIGKWHLGDEIQCRRGFDDWISIEDSYADNYGSSHDKKGRSSYHRFLVENGYSPDRVTPDGGGKFSRSFAAELPEPMTKARFVADRAIEFLERHAHDPFVLFVNFFEPHMPFYGPRNSEYSQTEIPLPASFDDDLSDKPQKIRLFEQAYRRNGQDGIDLSDRRGWSELIRRYWGLVSLVDSEVGRILNAAARLGSADRTIVVFTSDHGDMMGAHRLVGKCVMFEEAIRVPLLISVPPNIVSRYDLELKRYRFPVSQIDLLPTLLELLGSESNGELQGESLIRNVRRLPDRSPENREVFVEWNGLNSGFGDVVGDTNILPEWRELADDLSIKAALDDPVRTIVTNSGMKYTWSHRGEDTLFDLNSDPFEMHNLAGSTDSESMFRSRIEEWQSVTLDPVVFG